MFPVFASLLMILKSVSRCFCHIEKQPCTTSPECGQQETHFADFPDCVNGVRHSVYLGIKEKQISVSFFFTTIFTWLMLDDTTRLYEFRLVKSEIRPKEFRANSPYILFELIRHIPMGAQGHPMRTFPCAEIHFFKSVFPMDGLRIYDCVLTMFSGSIPA